MDMHLYMSTLGTRGRWGNQLFQYCWMRAMSEKMGATLHLPHDWIGRKLFDVPFWPDKGCASCRRRIDLDAALVNGTFDQWLGRLDGYDVLTYAQHQRYLDAYTRAQAKSWLTLQPEWVDYEDKLLTRFPKDYAVCHVRRGDYEIDPFCRLYATISEGSYLSALKKFSIPEDALWIQEGWREPSGQVKSVGMPWLDDFLIIKNAKTILRSNSSFAWWAATLSDARVYSPLVESRVGRQDVEFVAGNWPKTANFPNQSDLRLAEA